jgi:hypothetical protein
MPNYSPYGPAAAGEYYYDKEATPSPTPSPRGPRWYPSTPQQARPATRAHFRQGSTGFDSFSPRYTSTGQYATANVSSSRASRKQEQQWSSPRTGHRRRNSYSYYRVSDSHGESDEDEIVEIDGITYVWPAKSRFKRYTSTRDRDYDDRHGGYGTDRYYFAQTSSPYSTPFADKEAFTSPRYEPEPKPSHRRRASTSTPQRPSTARPASSHRKQPPSTPKATEADAKKHRIPKGYSLKNWDPTEEPIFLLGSVFDANSLGKWVYDWTVYHHGAATPISDMAGDLWLLLIQLFGKVKRADEACGRIRSRDNKEMMEDFIESGERLADKLRKLLKTCEAPMLRASKRKDTQLGKNSGVEFVETLFGRERELARTEQFMQSVRLWNLRFDANCEEIIRKPYM